jgi:predicted outer membrane protein
LRTRKELSCTEPSPSPQHWRQRWASPAAAGPTDPQIAHTAYTAGLIDIEAGKQALNKSQNNDVRAFAQQK